MFLFIVYGVGPRHCQNVGSKSTAKAQLWDTPSVKLTDVKVGKRVHPLPCSAAASPRLWAPVGLASGSAQSHAAPSLQRSRTSHAPHLQKGRGLTPHTSLTSRRAEASHTPLSLPGGQLTSAPSVPWEQSAQDLLGTSCSSKKMGQNTVLTKPPQLFPEPENFPPAAIFSMHQHELAADSIKKHNKT